MEDKEFKRIFLKYLVLFYDSKFLVEKLLWERKTEPKLKHKLLKNCLSNLKSSLGFFESASLCFKREAHEIELKKFNFIRRGVSLGERPICLNCNKIDSQIDYVQFVSCGHGYHKECLKINKNEKYFKCFKCSI